MVTILDLQLNVVATTTVSNQGFTHFVQWTVDVGGQIQTLYRLLRHCRDEKNETIGDGFSRSSPLQTGVRFADARVFGCVLAPEQLAATALRLYEFAPEAYEELVHSKGY